MIGWVASRLLPLIPRRIVHAVAKRYVAGEDLSTAAGVVRALNDRGWDATLDVLGEDARDAEVADRTVQDYLNVLDRIRADSLRCNVSLKLTHLGLRLDRDAARDRLLRVTERARDLGNFVRIDMEDSSVTDATLETYRFVRAHGGPVGAVLQASLRRTVDDARGLAAMGANVRLCKGIYREPRTIAFRGREEVRSSFLQAAEVLLGAPGTHVAFATHDRLLIGRCLDLAARMDVPADRYEFQALLGVPVEDVLDGLVSRGIRVRVYVPFGEEWFPYASRRLRENPRIASYVLRQMFKPATRAHPRSGGWPGDPPAGEGRPRGDTT